MKIKCIFCQKKIDTKKERYVNLKTLDKEKTIEDLFFHINCWRAYFNQKVQEKSINIIKASVPQVTQLIKTILPAR
jgi:hypothetical protein